MRFVKGKRQNNMRILLFEPPFERFQGIKRGFFPLGLISLAAHIKSLGHTVTVYDGEHDPSMRIMPYADAAKAYEKYITGLKDDTHAIWKEIEDYIISYKPDVVGIGALTPKYPSGAKIASISKRLFPDVPVIMGGFHPTGLGHRVIEDKNVDFVVVGEGEKTTEELLQAISEKGGYENIPGIIFKNGGKTVTNPPRALCKELDSFDFPARKVLHKYNEYISEDMGLIMGSRGCPFVCTYCASKKMWARNVRFRSAEKIVDEMVAVHNDFGTTQFAFEDDSFTTNKKLVYEFCELLKKKLDVKWSAITRINLIDNDMLDAMKKAGCNHIRVGIESGSAKILKDTKKGLTLEAMRKGAEVLRKNKIYWSAYFMIGLPTETESDVVKTIEFMKQIRPDYCTVSIFTPYPGTEIFYDLIRQGIISENMDWAKFSHGSPYNNFAIKMGQEKFREMLEYAVSEFDKYNSNYLRLFKRAASKAKIYLNEPKELLRDIERYRMWKGK